MSRIKEKAYSMVQENKDIFLVAVLAGFLAYGYVFTNKLPNWDDITALFWKGLSYSLGRWMVPHLHWIFPNQSMPWLYGIESLVFVAISACVIIRLFKISNKYISYILCACIVTFPAFTSTLAYTFCCAPFMMSMCMAVIAAYLFTRKGVWSCVLGIILLVLSTAIYQIYFALAAGLLVLELLKCTLDGEMIPEIVKKGIKRLFCLIISAGIYGIITLVTLRVHNVEFSNRAEAIEGVKGLFLNVAYAYKCFFEMIFGGLFNLASTQLSQVLHGVGFTLLVVVLLYKLFHIHDKGRIIIAVALIAILPLSINCLYIVLSEDNLGTMESFSFIVMYVLAALLLDTVDKRIKVECLLYDFSCFALGCIILCNIYVANRSWLELHMAYENLYATYSAITTQVKMTPGFDENSKVALIGERRENP